MIEFTDPKSRAVGSTASARYLANAVDLKSAPGWQRSHPSEDPALLTGAAARMASADNGGEARLRILRSLIQSAWRRRFLLVVPVLVMVLLSVAAALLLPRSYEARTLLLLQETVRDNPLAPTVGGQNVVPERLAGLQALLKSEQVLSKTIHDWTNGAILSGEALAVRIQDLNHAISLDLIGTDFLQIRLRAGSAEGLGGKLEDLTSRFQEALVAAGVLNAAERIRTIDPPKDPEFATRSRIVYVLAGLAAGVCLGIALMWAAELLDQTIYHPDQLLAWTNVPVIASLPGVAPVHQQSAPFTEPQRRRSFRWRVLFPLAIVFFIMSAALLLSQRSELVSTMEYSLGQMAEGFSAWIGRL